MTHRPLRVLPVLALLAATAACGEPQVYTAAPEETADSEAPQTPDAPSPAPTAAPWPSYDVSDYSFTLAVMCFCADQGTPVRVTVEGGEVAEAVYVDKRGGRLDGQAAPKYRRLTINDVIAAANDPKADEVKVRWREGDDYPRLVWVDPDERSIDEEVSYSIRDVEPAT